MNKPKKLNEYNKKRDFYKTAEPKGNLTKSSKKLIYCIQHHMSRKEHYDLRLQWNGVLLSWAVPKGPSFNPTDKRLAIKVEDHPLDYAEFEGTIPKGEYGGGTVMLWDKGEWEPYGDVDEGLEKGTIKFTIYGERLVGSWLLTVFKTDEKNTWLLIKENDEFSNNEYNIEDFNTSIKTQRTMHEIAENTQTKISSVEINKKLASFIKMDGKNYTVEGVTITSPDKVVFNKSKVKKLDIVLYYAYIFKHIFPYIEDRLITSVRCPKGVGDECFYFRNLAKKDGKPPVNYGLFAKEKDELQSNETDSNNEKNNYFYLKNSTAFINEVQLGTLEFHIWGSMAKSINKPDIMIFDLDPNDDVSLTALRQGVKHLKSLLDNLGLVSFLKTSGKKGYHILVPFEKHSNWQTFRDFANKVSKVMEEMWPNLYTSNSRKDKRKGKIYVDWVRNIKGSTTVAPRVSEDATVSFPIAWEELSRIKPNSITMKKACQRVEQKNPWKGFFEVKQKLT